jgi:hypothetical protein
VTGAVSFCGPATATADARAPKSFYFKGKQASVPEIAKALGEALTLDPQFAAACFAAKLEGEYHDLPYAEACFKNVESDSRYKALRQKIKMP